MSKESEFKLPKWAEDEAIMYRVDCYKGNATNPEVRESYADQGYAGFLAGIAFVLQRVREAEERDGRRDPGFISGRASVRKEILGE